MTVHNASHLLDYGGWFDKDMETTMADVWQVRDTLEDWKFMKRKLKLR
jgi:hypothetical protein